MRPVHGLAVVCFVSALAACIDFVDPMRPEAGAPALLYVFVDVRDAIGPETRFRIYASLRPGVDSAGAARRVLDHTLWVGGVPLAPTSTRRDAAREYEAELELDVGQVAAVPLTIEPPTIAGVSSEPAMARLYPLHRAGPDTIALSTGEDLILRLAGSPLESEPPPTSTFWSVDLIPDDSAHARVVINGFGEPLSTIRIPADWLSGLGGADFQAELDSSSSGETVREDASYRVSIRFALAAEWYVRWIDAEGREP